MLKTTLFFVKFSAFLPLFFSPFLTFDIFFTFPQFPADFVSFLLFPLPRRTSFCSVFRNCQKLLTTKAAKTAPVENKTVFIASRVLNKRLFGCERNSIFVTGNKVLLKMNSFAKLFSTKLIELVLTRKNHLTFKDKT